LTLSRLDLDGLGSPAAIAACIHSIETEMPLAVPLKELCRKLDIVSIEEIDTSGFEAALVMDANKAAGGILVAAGRTRQRQRYSISHELGHFLIPTHLPRAGKGFECSLADLHLLDPREQDRRKRIEAEANKFAAALLMPKARIRANATSGHPDLGDIVRLAREFDVSKEAMARTYVEAEREAVAVIILRRARIERVYRSEDFPWIGPRIGQPIPTGSIADAHRLQPGQRSEPEECEADVWFSERVAARVDLLTEQLLGQADGFAMLLLHAELADEDHLD
jgi:Zn-dependent peptidase ImmA (M78 family)